MDDKNSEYNLVPPHRRPRDPLEARQSLILCLVVGAFTYVLGYVVVVLAWPHQSLDDDGLSASGSTGWLIVGGVVAIAGLMLFLVGIIGFGVKIGREAARV